MPRDPADEYERLSRKLFDTLSSIPKAGFVPISGGAYFDAKCIEACLRAAQRALDAEPTNDMIRLARAMLLMNIYLDEESATDARVLVSRGAEYAKVGRLILKQLRQRNGHAI